MGSLDQNILMNNLDKDAWLGSFIFLMEWSHQWLDYVPRSTTGRLTKTSRLLGMSAPNVSIMNLEASKRYGKVMGMMEDCYPQLLATIYVCNWRMQVPWRIVRPLLPKRVVCKVDFISPTKSEKEKKRLCRHVSQEHLAHILVESMTICLLRS
jgi:hypothetical protein